MKRAGKWNAYQVAISSWQSMVTAVFTSWRLQLQTGCSPPESRMWWYVGGATTDALGHERGERGLPEDQPRAAAAAAAEPAVAAAATRAARRRSGFRANSAGADDDDPVAETFSLLGVCGARSLFL